MSEQRFYAFFDDFVFKWVFGRKGNEPLLMKLLNTLLHFEGDDCIVSLQLLNPFNLKETRKGKMSVVDVKASDGSGRQFTIEVQASGEPEFTTRAFYYLAKLYSSQIGNADEYTVIRPAFGVNILNFILFPGRPSLEATYLFQERRSHDILPNAMELHFIEVPKLRQPRKRSLMSRFEKWLNVLKRGDRFGSGLESLDELDPEEDMVMAVQELRKINADRIKREQIESLEKARRDELWRRNNAERQGLADGLAKGLADGLAKGREEGREEERRLIIQKLLTAGNTPTQISSMLGIPIEEIEKLMVTDSR